MLQWKAIYINSLRCILIKTHYNLNKALIITQHVLTTGLVRNIGLRNQYCLRCPFRIVLWKPFWLYPDFSYENLSDRCDCQVPMNFEIWHLSQGASALKCIKITLKSIYVVRILIINNQSLHAASPGFGSTLLPDCYWH